MNESFFENARELMNELKVRASYGTLGNLNGIGMPPSRLLGQA